MNLILDTHTFLWYTENNSKLSSRAIKLMADAETVNLSAAVYWEIIIKYRLGKIKLETPPEEFIYQQMTKNFLQKLDITFKHLDCLATMPLHHRDPFDRILVAQAMTEKSPILSVDKQLKRYDVEVLW